jgi:hypothetical protein
LSDYTPIKFSGPNIKHPCFIILKTISKTTLMGFEHAL